MCVFVCIWTYSMHAYEHELGIAEATGALNLMLTLSTVANMKATRNDSWSSCHTWRADSQQRPCLSACILWVCIRVCVHVRFHHGRVSNRACFKGNTNPQKWGVRSIFPCLIGCRLIWLRNSLHDIPLSRQYRPTSRPIWLLRKGCKKKGDRQTGRRTDGRRKWKEWNWDLTSKC